MDSYKQLVNISKSISERIRLSHLDSLKLSLMLSYSFNGSINELNKKLLNIINDEERFAKSEEEIVTIFENIENVQFEKLLAEYLLLEINQ